MKKSDFYFDLPKELIAQTPLLKRDTSKLMVLDKNTGEVTHKHFYDILEYLHPGDCLVMNDSRVIGEYASAVGKADGTALAQLGVLNKLGNLADLIGFEKIGFSICKASEHVGKERKEAERERKARAAAKTTSSRSSSGSSRKKQSAIEKSINKTINKTANTIGRELGKQLVRGLLGTLKK